jgi:lysophospholipase L1-like esterase
LDWSYESINHINNDTSTDVVVIAYRIHSALFGINRYRNYPNLPDEIDIDEREARWLSLIKIINSFLEKNKDVILLLPPPELPFDINQLISVYPEDDIYGVTRDWWDRRSDYVNRKIYQISDKVKIIDPVNDFCDQENCYAVKNSMALYWDDNHLSQYGASIIAKEIINSLESALDK